MELGKKQVWSSCDARCMAGFRLARSRPKYIIRNISCSANARYVQSGAQALATRGRGDENININEIMSYFVSNVNDTVCVFEGTADDFATSCLITLFCTIKKSKLWAMYIIYLSASNYWYVNYIYKYYICTVLYIIKFPFYIN